MAVAISDRYTNEEAYAMMKVAEVMGAKTLCMNNRESGLEKVTGLKASPNTIDELLSTNVILKIGFDENNSRVIAVKMKQAEEAGAKVINLCSGENDLGFLKEIAKAIIDSGKAKKVAGYDEFAASLADVKVSERAK